MIAAPAAPPLAGRPSLALNARRDALAADLRGTVRGEVLFDAGDRALYATDSSNYRQLPIGVVRPLDAEDLVETVRVCRAHDAPVTLRGGGTSLAGQATNVAVIVDASRHMNRILEIDPRRRIARVEPGVVLDDLRAAAGAHGLTFGPDPATHDRCTLGGMLGNDSCGAHSIMAGRTRQNVVSLEVLTYDGVRLTVGPTSDEELGAILSEGGRRAEIYGALRALRDRHAVSIRDGFPKLPRLVSGYALDALLPEAGFDVAQALVGSEGTCVTILEATLRLVDDPPGRALVVLGYDDVFAACDRVPQILETGPIALEGVDERFIADCRKKRLHLSEVERLPRGRGWLIVEYGAGSDEAAAARASEALAVVRSAGGSPDARLVSDRHEQEAVWGLRESALGATAIVPGEPPTWPGWEDSAVPPARLGAYLRELDGLLGEFGYDYAYYGHFGDGCVHMRADFDLQSAAGAAVFRSFVERAADLVVRHGGSLSGEHGDGQARGELLPRLFGPELMAAFGEFKAIWDPDNRMNPGKVVAPNRLDADLRAALPQAAPPTIFRYPDDGGSFGRAVLRCVGVGKCRRESGGLMCPSYMASREEKHSTRGRARLLFEMLDGEALPDLWRSEAVREALDLCLACKGCKGDCPTSVDMATYKAEFMAHHYAGRLRPRAAYSMGLIHWWSHLARIAPGLANRAGATRGLATLAKLAAGVDPGRRIPPFAERPFRTQLPPGTPDLGAARSGRERVILFADTFTDGFLPDQGLAALRLLRAAGFGVEVPRADLCCGRPLYDWGFLGQARRLLRRTLEVLGPQLDDDVEVVVLEPSCASAFRDELPNLFPDDRRARRLAARTVVLADFVRRHGGAFEPILGRLDAPALLHGHCHQKALMGMADERAALRSIGLDATEPEPGCCGMAGAFGFERGEHYRLAMAIGERELLPAVRSAPTEALLVADGFSCREQIQQAAGRRPLHLAEVLAQALVAPAGE